MLRACMSLYSGFECAVRVNGQLTNWFSAELGVKQGCLLSPLLFDFYINSLADDIKQLDMGITVGTKRISIMLYADDVVLLTDNAKDLQRLLDTVSIWCSKWRLTLNPDKTKIVVFRNRPVQEPSIQFTCGGANIEYANAYKYLGLELNCHLDWEKTVKALVASASRAWGAIVAKSRAFGGFNYGTIIKLYDAVVRPILEYSSEIWGHKTYKIVESFYNRVCRTLMCVGRYTPNEAVVADTGIKAPIVRQQVNQVRLWLRLCKMDDIRGTKQIFLATKDLAAKGRNNWCKRLNILLNTLQMEELKDIVHCAQVNNKETLRTVLNKSSVLYETNWYNKLNAPRPQGAPGKLRYYKLYKTSIYPEPYVTNYMNKGHRRAFAQFRTGTAPLKCETLRYGSNKIPFDQRICDFCDLHEPEDEVHALIRCPFNRSIRTELFKVANEVSNDFSGYNDIEKFLFLISDYDVMKDTARSCYNVLLNRRDFIYCKELA